MEKKTKPSATGEKASEVLKNFKAKTGLLPKDGGD